LKLTECQSQSAEVIKMLLITYNPGSAIKKGIESWIKFEAIASIS
jgi:hypothetical protein